MVRKVSGVQNVSHMCLVCGVENTSGLGARFFELEGGELLGSFHPHEEHQSYPGRLHGGLASTLLDETIGRAIAINHPEAFGVTIELTVKYRKPVPLDSEVRAIGRITNDRGRIFEGTGEILLEDGTIAVEGHGRYMRMPIDRIAEGDFETEWLVDEREAPNAIDL